MFDFKKYLTLIITTLQSIVSYIPAMIYEYVFSHFFTLYTYTYPEKLTDKSEKEIRREKKLKMCWISVLLLDTPYTALLITFKAQM
jgi:hypothetical protein